MRGGRVRKARRANLPVSELEQKILSSRSKKKKFKGGGMQEKKGKESSRTNMVLAKPLNEMPDYSNEATRETES